MTKSGAYPLLLKCGVCNGELQTPTTLMSERRELIAQFDLAHAVCRTREQAQREIPLPYVPQPFGRQMTD